MHKDEQWQEYTHYGAPLNNGGRPSNHVNNDDREGIYGVSCVWLYRRTENEVEILFQHRSEYVDRYAGFWDISAAGHINYGETPYDAAVREAKEEIGAEINVEKLRYVVSYNNGYRIANVYLYDYTNHPENFTFDDYEVSGVKWVPLSEVEEFWKRRTKETLAKDTFQLKILSKILNKINDGNSQQ